VGGQKARTSKVSRLSQKLKQKDSKDGDFLILFLN